MKKYYFLLIGLLIGILFIFFFILKVDRKLTHVEIFIKEPILYIEKIVEVPFNHISNKLNILKSKSRLVKDLKKYKKIESENNYLKALVNDKNQKIEELSNLVNINIGDDYRIINANIIVRNVGFWYQTLTLDKGYKDGILKNSMVINSNGLIGIIDKVTKHTSVVKMLTSVSDNYKVGVLINNGEDSFYGILSDFKDGMFVVRGISYNKEIKKGALVTTSGLDNNFISGIKIGKVKRVDKDDLDLEQIVYVDAAVDFNKMNYVSVVVK